MEKIELLLDKLDNRITSSLAKRLDKLDDINEKLDLSGEEYEKNPTDENREKYNEVIEYVEQVENGIIKDLEALLQKREEEVKAQQKPVVETPKVVTPTTEIPSQENKEEKKEGSGVLGLVIGGILLVGSLGAINYFKNNK
jgi:hypothetical protein